MNQAWTSETQASTTARGAFSLCGVNAPQRIVNVDYRTIRRQARGFYWLIVGEGRSPKPTIKGERNRERAVQLFYHTSVIDLSSKKIFFILLSLTHL